MRRVLVAAVLAFSFAAPAETATVTLKCRNDAHCALSGEVVARSVADPSTERRFPIADAAVVVTGNTTSEWELTLASAGYWAAPLRITTSGATNTWDVWRTGRLHVAFKSRDALPDGARVVVASPPDPRHSPAITAGTYFDCTAGTDATQWNCEVPATLLDLSVRGKGGYAPHYRWGIEVPHDRALDLGTFEMRKGASILAWLDPAFLTRSGQPVRASIRHQAAADTSLTAVRLAVPVAEATFTKQGFVQLAPLAAGRYVVDVQSKGYSPVHIPVELIEGRESVLRQTIALQPSAALRLRLVPPLGPGEAPWRISLWRRTDFGTGSEAAGSGIASAEGIFEALDQAEGMVFVHVADAQGNLYARREMVVMGNDAEQLLSLDVVAIHGTVSIGDEPLPDVSLLFGGNGGKEQVRITANHEGRFEAFLPRTGQWKVDVASEKEAVSATVVISIDDVEVDIELPSTEVSGIVRRSDGEPSNAAEIRVFSEKGFTSRRAESDGTFRIRGIAEGKVHLQAEERTSGESSQMVLTELTENEHKEGIELRLESLRNVRGIVRSGGYPVIGARVTGYAFSGGSASQLREVTDRGGAFSFDIPVSAPEMNIMVAAVGSIYQPFRVRTKEAITLDLAPAGGELRLQWPAGPPLPRMRYNDVDVVMNDILEWGRANGRTAEGGTLTVPLMAPGHYQLCAAAQCADGSLAPGATLTLTTRP